MAGSNNGSGFDDDPTCYSNLLLTDDFPLGLDETDGCFATSNSSTKMLCFGDYNPTPRGPNKSVPTCTGSDPVNSTKNKASSTLSNNKRNGSGSELTQVDLGTPTRTQGKRKSRSDNSIGHAKVVKKEKLGERITALQQLVSPFGKTDTASVLHEASGYIRFLQDQVQVLCSPYLQCLPPSLPPQTQPVESGENKENDGRRKDDLKSRGLCLVPLELTLHVAESNGADLWSSSIILNNVSSN